MAVTEKYSICKLRNGNYKISLEFSNVNASLFVDSKSHIENSNGYEIEFRFYIKGGYKTTDKEAQGKDVFVLSHEFENKNNLKELKLNWYNDDSFESSNKSSKKYDFEPRQSGNGGVLGITGNETICH